MRLRFGLRLGCLCSIKVGNELFAFTHEHRVSLLPTGRAWYIPEKRALSQLRRKPCGAWYTKVVRVALAHWLVGSSIVPVSPSPTYGPWQPSTQAHPHRPPS